MKNKILILSLFAMLSILSNCKKSEPISSLSQFFSENAPQAETFEFQAENGISVTTKRGSKILIKPSSLLNSNGDVVTGNVVMRFKEVFTNSDMIFSGIYPLTYGYILNSGGAFYIEVKKDNEKLRIKKDLLAKVEIPPQVTFGQDNMILYSGSNEEFPLDSTIFWVPEFDTTRLSFNRNGGNLLGYVVTLESFKWVNFDYNLSLNNSMYTFDLKHFSKLNQDDMKVFAVLKNENTAFNIDTRGKIANEALNSILLPNTVLSLILITQKEGKLFYGLVEDISTAKSKYVMELKALTGNELKGVIVNFP